MTCRRASGRGGEGQQNQGAHGGTAPQWQECAIGLWLRYERVGHTVAGSRGIAGAQKLLTHCGAHTSGAAHCTQRGRNAAGAFRVGDEGV